VKYGVRLGPLVELPRPDPGDDRHHFDLEKKAAALSERSVQYRCPSSSLLLMACYNWGEDRVLPLYGVCPTIPRNVTSGSCSRLIEVRSQKHV
jgi:hypothetical protein